MNAIAYAHDHRQEADDRLRDLLSIPSISTLPENRESVELAARWLVEELKGAGLENVTISPTKGHPVVYADWLHAEGAPTVLIYAHYDVQPVDPLDEWETSPFDPTLRHGNLYARGASDDKGQLMVHVRALDALLQSTGRLPVNVRVLFEGEEEIGSVHLDEWLEANRERLAADVALISDSHILSPDQPTIVYGLRGLAYIEVHVRSAKGDMHSGTYGGAIHNPIQALCELISQLHDEEGHITVPGFYDQVVPLSEAERREMARVPYGEAELLAETGALKAWGEPEYTVTERVSARPTLELNGIWGGFTGQGAKTVLPAKASAKISMRLVPDQDPWQMAERVRRYLRAIAPPTIEVDVVDLHHGYGALVPTDTPAMQAASDAYEEVFGNRPIFVRTGGSIPVVSSLQRLLGLDTVLMGFGLPDDNLHAPNEKFNLNLYHKGIETAIAFYEKYGRVS
ncbi:MAG: dipeptidase [Anaerolineales bacterium]|nr:dipeptidase [Anaerolineales bacterium]MCB9127716.1 dipeptidase [Ardenticatenales bacterium]